MEAIKMRAMTIIADVSVQDALEKQLLSWGVDTYMVFESATKASVTCHAGEVKGRHVRIEAIVPDSVADDVREGLQRDYFGSCSTSYFECDVVVKATTARGLCDRNGRSEPREVPWGDYLITL